MTILTEIFSSQVNIRIMLSLISFKGTTILIFLFIMLFRKKLFSLVTFVILNKITYLDSFLFFWPSFMKNFIYKWRFIYPYIIGKSPLLRIQRICFLIKYLWSGIISKIVEVLVVLFVSKKLTFCKIVVLTTLNQTSSGSVKISNLILSKE